MSYDLIIVTRSEPNLRQMTQDCITSCCVRTIVVETSGEPVYYEGVEEYVLYEGEFNYNRALNMGLERATGDIQILANNDLLFYEGWEAIGDYMKDLGYDSGSAWFDGCVFPFGAHVYEGMGIAHQLTGWCLFVTKEAIKKIGKLDERVDFWYSDNLYAEQLRYHKLRHGLFCNVRVDHLGSRTLKTMPIKIQRHYSAGQIGKYKICQRQNLMS